MICVSLMAERVADVIAALEKTPGLQMAEIRLDGIRSGEGDISRIFRREIPLVATCRPTAARDEHARAAVLIEAIDAGAAWVDLEIESGADFKAAVIPRARARGCRVIVSYHNYEGTPPVTELREIVDACFEQGADLAKVACLATQPREAARLLGLMDSTRPVLALGMGEAGRITRIAATLVGAPFTFAAIDEASCTAPGQYPLAALKKIYREIGAV